MQRKYKMSHYKIYTETAEYTNEVMGKPLLDIAKTAEYTKELMGKPGLCIPNSAEYTKEVMGKAGLCILYSVEYTKEVMGKAGLCIPYSVEYTKELMRKPGLCILQFFNTQMKQQDGWFVYFLLLITLQTLKIDSAGSIDRAVTNGINDTINTTRRINTE